MGSPLRRVRLESTPQFQKDLACFPAVIQEQIWQILDEKFVSYLAQGHHPANGLRLRGFQNEPGLFEMTLTPLSHLRIKYKQGKSQQPDEIRFLLLQLGCHKIYKKRAKFQ